MILVRFVCAAALALGCSVPASAGNLLRGGSFEKPVVADGQLQRFSTGEKFSGWKVVGEPGSVDIITSTFNFEGQDFPAKRGRQWLDLTGASNTATGVQRTVSTAPGATYEISLYIGSAFDKQGQLGTSSTVHVLVDGAEIASFTSRGQPGVSQRWRKVSTQFVAQNAATAIAFINGDPATDTDCGIDGVGVTHVATP